MFFKISDGLEPSLSSQIFIFFIFDVFCACLKSGALVNKIISPSSLSIKD